VKFVILGNTKLNYSWFVLTFRQGLLLNKHDVFEIDYRTNNVKQIKNKLMNLKADYCFTHLTFHLIHPLKNILNVFFDVNKKVGTKFIHVLCDARHEPRYNSNISGAFYAALLNQTHNLEKFRKYWGIPVFFMPYCSMTYKEMAKPVNELKYNFVFTGSMSHRKRTSFIKKLKNFDLKIIQTQSKQDLRHRTLELAASAKAILSLCTGYEITHYNEVRPWQYLGAGACLLHKKFKGEDDLIPPEIYYEIDFDIKTVGEKLNLALTKDTMPMRKKAFAFMQRYHSSKERIKNVIACLEGKQTTTKSFLKELL